MYQLLLGLYTKRRPEVWTFLGQKGLKLSLIYLFLPLTPHFSHDYSIKSVVMHLKKGCPSIWRTWGVLKRIGTYSLGHFGLLRFCPKCVKWPNILFCKESLVLRKCETLVTHMDPAAQQQHSAAVVDMQQQQNQLLLCVRPSRLNATEKLSVRRAFSSHCNSSHSFSTLVASANAVNCS